MSDQERISMLEKKVAALELALQERQMFDVEAAKLAVPTAIDTRPGSVTHDLLTAVAAGMR